MSVSLVDCVRGEGVLRLERRARLVDAGGERTEAAPGLNEDERSA